ncbi:hypothetical protein KIN20_001016 [Parelaphostrongylus tenuis]|uniref:SCP domain-containing protein n=1 Tax=Parelaphostrongylus tenuis TaxID=148309 RepID=A0AAD5LXC0_PARTN|nr:hypothetical protein KIN20_001016 [Parelaphostrongylus tenuis]
MNTFVAVVIFVAQSTSSDYHSQIPVDVDTLMPDQLSESEKLLQNSSSFLSTLLTLNGDGSEWDCNGTFMRVSQRLYVSTIHNINRGALANGTVGSYPKADNMSYLFYSCALENSSFEIAKLCLNETQPNFNYVGSNNSSTVTNVEKSSRTF